MSTRMTQSFAGRQVWGVLLTAASSVDWSQVPHTPALMVLLVNRKLEHTCAPDDQEHDRLLLCQGLSEDYSSIECFNRGCVVGHQTPMRS